MSVIHPVYTQRQYQQFYQHYQQHLTTQQQ